MLAALADLPQATFANRIVVHGDSIHVTRDIDGGSETLSLKLPAVVTADLRLNEPRYVTLPSIMKAKKKAIDVIEASTLDVDIAPRMKTLGVREPPQRKAGVMVPDVAALVAVLQDELKVN